MIIVRVELHSAITGTVRELARMRICNTGDGSKELGDYEAVTFTGRNEERLDQAMHRNRITRNGSVKNHPRLRQHVWNLVAKALASMRYGE